MSDVKEKSGRPDTRGGAQPDSRSHGTEISSGIAPNRPKLLVPLGRGKGGKTVLARWVAERTRQFGLPIVVADADRTNRTLAAYFPDAVSPPGTYDNVMREWLDQLLEKQIETQTHVVLDLGGGDLMLKRAAEELPLVEMLDRHGIDAVAVHMIGPDVDDLAYLRDVELERVFAPPQTVLCFNDGVVLAGMEPGPAFEPITKHPVLRAAVERGARVVRMPRLGCMREVDRLRAGFLPLTQGAELGPMNRQRIQTWWEKMEEAFAPVAEWLPR